MSVVSTDKILSMVVRPKETSNNVDIGKKRPGFVRILIGPFLFLFWTWFIFSKWMLVVKVEEPEVADLMLTKRWLQPGPTAEGIPLVHVPNLQSMPEQKDNLNLLTLGWAGIFLATMPGIYLTYPF